MLLVTHWGGTWCSSSTKEEEDNMFLISLIFQAVLFSLRTRCRAIAGSYSGLLVSGVCCSTTTLLGVDVCLTFDRWAIYCIKFDFFGTFFCSRVCMLILHRVCLSLSLSSCCPLIPIISRQHNVCHALWFWNSFTRIVNWIRATNWNKERHNSERRRRRKIEPCVDHLHLEIEHSNREINGSPPAFLNRAVKSVWLTKMMSAVVLKRVFCGAWCSPPYLF